MPSMKLPSNVSTITVAGFVKVPSGGRIDLNDDHFATLTGAGGIATKPYLVSTNLATGATVLKFPSIVEAITIDAVEYIPVAGLITVPAAAASNFLEQDKYAL